MGTKGNSKPPQWAIALFRWFCQPGFREEIEGDLLERFHKRSKQCGPRRNKLLFIIDILALCRPRLMSNFGRLTLNCLSMMKRILRKYAEFYLIVVALLCGYTPPFSISFVSVGIIVLLMLQFFFKYKITGNLIGALFILANLYMFLALLSEFSEFPAFTVKAQKLLFVGSSIIALNVIAGGAMLVKYGLVEDICNSSAHNNQGAL